MKCACRPGSRCGFTTAHRSGSPRNSWSRFMSSPRNTVSVVAVTHRGAVRSRNEDTIAIGPWLCCKDLVRPVSLSFELTADEILPCLVADGLGGHAAGQLASHIAAHSLIIDLWGAPAGGLADRVAESVRSANRTVYERMQGDPELAEMGST